jgi:hypothetical protein
MPSPDVELGDDRPVVGAWRAAPGDRALGDRRWRLRRGVHPDSPGDESAADEDVVDQLRARAKDARKAPLRRNHGREVPQPPGVAVVWLVETGRLDLRPERTEQDLRRRGQRLVVEVPEHHNRALVPVAPEQIVGVGANGDRLPCAAIQGVGPNRARSPSSRVLKRPAGNVRSLDFRWQVTRSTDRPPLLTRTGVRRVRQ